MTIYEKARKIAARLAYIYDPAIRIDVKDILNKATPAEICFYYHHICEAIK